MSGRLVAADMEDSNRASELGAEGSSDAAEKGVHPDPSQPAVLSPLLRHYDPTQDIVLRVECVSDEAMKRTVGWLELVVLTSLAMLLVAMILKGREGNGLMTKRTIPLMNVAMGSLAAVEVIFLCFYFYWKVFVAIQSGGRWTVQRKRLVVLAELELGIQTINILSFLVANAYQLAKPCEFFPSLIIWLGFVQWSCWNSISVVFWIHAASFASKTQDAASEEQDSWRMAYDQPLWRHWPKLLVWAAFEGFNIATAVLAQAPGGLGDQVPDVLCTDSEPDCTQSAGFIVTLIMAGVILLAYYALFLWDLRRGFVKLGRYPYNQFRVGNRLLRIQIRVRVMTAIGFVICCILYTLAPPNVCVAYWISFLGYLPMQVLMTALAAVNTFLLCPIKPSEHSILLAWLQEFAWTEDSIAEQLKIRSSSLPAGSKKATEVTLEPIWCFETAVKLLHWAGLCYSAEGGFVAYDPGLRQGECEVVSAALLLYGMAAVEMVWEETADTRCLMGWGEGRVVVAFRGTASTTNLLADMKVWRARWPIQADTSWLRPPMVHAGFLRCYLGGGFRDRLLAALGRCLARAGAAGGPAARPPAVYVTGHSLGGALAMLAALDVALELAGSCPLELRCYTFGAPRVGNAAFARLYARNVPDTWHVVNNDDMLTRNGRFLGLYKRMGHRVLVNSSGDLIVRPDYIEKLVHRLPGGGSLSDHRMMSYRRSFAAVLRAQFGSKAILGGRAAALVLSKAPGTGALMRCTGIRAEELEAAEAAKSSLASCYESAGFCTCCFLLSCPPWAASAVAAEAEAELEPDHVLGTELVSVRGGNKAPAEAMATPPGQAACARGP